MTFPSDHDPVERYDIEEVIFWPGVILVTLMIISLIFSFIVLCKTIFFGLKLWPWSLYIVITGGWPVVIIVVALIINKKRES